MTKLPNFLIVGAAKSGTTSLYEYLRTHPQIFMPETKEPSYFEPKAGGISSWEEYRRLFDGAGTFPRVGEASVSYLMSPGAPERIEQTLGRDLDIIVLLRNPIHMAYSLWGHMIREGYESLDFLAALYDEKRRLADPDYEKKVGRWLYDMVYVTRSSIGPQLEKYINRFGRDRVHVYLFEEFFCPGLPLYGDLLGALGVDKSHRPVEEAHNKAGTVRSTYLRRVLSERMAWKEPLKMIIPAPIRNRMMKGLAQFNRIDRPLPPISPEAVELLKAEFGGDVEFLSNLLNRDLKAFWGFGSHYRNFCHVR